MTPPPSRRPGSQGEPDPRPKPDRPSKPHSPSARSQLKGHAHTPSKPRAPKDQDNAIAPSPVPMAPSVALEQAAIRDLFWENMVREMLLGLSNLKDKHPEIFDGRFAVLTRGGERIPIGQVTPMFAMSMPRAEDKANSQAVQCTIFRLNTPDGEVFTLPLHEIRAVHSISPELVERLQATNGMEPNESEGSERQPFGLAAFTALPKPPPLPPSPAPQQPME